MEFQEPLLEGKLLKRYKRFMADIILESGEEITAHCPNSGAMLDIKEPGLRVWVSRAENPNRKLKYTWELVEADNTLIGANTGHPNALVEEAIRDGTIRELQGYVNLRREVKYGKNSRIDILLGDPGVCYVEVKNVHLKRGSTAAFPDSVTARGAKHMDELGDMVEAGHRAVIIYVVQRGDCEDFQVAADIDPTYNAACERAFERGVEAYVYCCDMQLKSIKITKPLPLRSYKSQ